jgi:hypothetical protein
MKNVLTSITVLIIALVVLSFGGCAMMQGAKEGRVVVTPLANKQYDIYSAGGISSDRSKIIKKWEEAADNTCNGKYTVVKEMTTGQSPGGSMTVEGRIRCN